MIMILGWVTVSGKTDPAIRPELLDDDELLDDEELLELEDELLVLDEELELLDDEEPLELLEDALAPVSDVVEPPQADKMADTEAIASQRDKLSKAVNERVIMISLRRLKAALLAAPAIVTDYMLHPIC